MKDETITFITEKGRNVTRPVTYSEEIEYDSGDLDVHFLEHDCKRATTGTKLNIAIVQLKYHLKKVGNVLIIEDNDAYSEKLTQILAAVKGKANIVVFPEFSIPVRYLPRMKTYSDESGIVIVAGSHYITDETLGKYDDMFYDEFNDEDDLRKNISPVIIPYSDESGIVIVAGSHYITDETLGKYDDMFYDEFNDEDDLRKNISPVIIPYSDKIYHTEKIVPAKEERKLFNTDGMTNGSLNRIFRLNNDVTFGVMICFDFINDDLRKRITNACDVILVPQANPGTKRFHKVGYIGIDNPKSAGNKAYIMASAIFTYDDGENKTDAQKKKIQKNVMGGDSGVILTLDKDSNKKRKDAIIETIEVKGNKVYEQFIQIAQLDMKFNPARDTQMGPVPITYNLIHIFEENEILKLAEDGKKDDGAPQAFLDLLNTIDSCEDKCELKKFLADNGKLIRKYSPLMHKTISKDLASLRLNEVKEKCASIVLN